MGKASKVLRAASAFLAVAPTATKPESGGSRVERMLTRVVEGLAATASETVSLRDRVARLERATEQESRRSAYRQARREMREKHQEEYVEIAAEMHQRLERLAPDAREERTAVMLERQNRSLALAARQAEEWQALRQSWRETAR